MSTPCAVVNVTVSVWPRDDWNHHDYTQIKTQRKGDGWYAVFTDGFGTPDETRVHGPHATAELAIAAGIHYTLRNTATLMRSCIEDDVRETVDV